MFFHCGCAHDDASTTVGQEQSGARAELSTDEVMVHSEVATVGGYPNLLGRPVHGKPSLSSMPEVSVVYLPETLRGLPVLVVESAAQGTFYVDLRRFGPGCSLRYRASMDLKDKDRWGRSVSQDKVVRGFKVGDNWVRVELQRPTPEEYIEQRAEREFGAARL